MGAGDFATMPVALYRPRNGNRQGSGVSSEIVFTVTGSSATAAQAISLADAGLKERGHLQEWVLSHTEMLGSDVKVVAFEFGRWTASSGALARGTDSTYWA
jgi:hypothetical protein